LIPPVETVGLRIGLRTDEPSTFLPFQLLGHKRKVPTLCQKAPQNIAWGVQALFGIANGSSEERCVCVHARTFTQKRVWWKGENREQQRARLNFDRFHLGDAVAEKVRRCRSWLRLAEESKNGLVGI
jgi:hypothetical protein